MDGVRGRAGHRRSAGAGTAHRDVVARWPRADPGRCVPGHPGLRRLVRPRRRRDRHRRGPRRRPDLPRAVPRVGVERAVQRAVGLRRPGPGARRTHRHGDGRKGGPPSEGFPQGPRRGGAQRVGWLAKRSLRRRRLLRLPRGLRRHHGPGRRPRRCPAGRGRERRHPGRERLRPCRHPRLGRGVDVLDTVAGPPGDPRWCEGCRRRLPDLGPHRRPTGSARSQGDGASSVRRRRRGRR